MADPLKKILSLYILFQSDFEWHNIITYLNKLL